jgi:hypothetical protein
MCEGEVIYTVDDKNHSVVDRDIFGYAKYSKNVSGSIDCQNSNFGDPAPGVAK